MKIRGADFIYYQTSDLDRAIEFYRDTLGLELLHHFEEVKWAEFSAGNITLALNDPTAFDPNAKAQTGGAADLIMRTLSKSLLLMGLLAGCGSDTEPMPTQAAEETVTPTPFVPVLREYPVPAGARPHDVAPAPDGGVWYTAQRQQALGYLDPDTGQTRHIPLGDGAAPHGVIVGPDNLAWITDSGLNAIVTVDPTTDAVRVYPLPQGSANANLNTATFDGDGVLWFTGQNGIYGRLDPAVGEVEIFPAPKGRGPYGIATTPDGSVYYASLAGSYVGLIALASAEVTVLEPPTADQGARRVWSDSAGRVWVSEWNGAQLARFDPATGAWREWRLPGDRPQPYAVYVDEEDMVWLSDFGANAMVRFDPAQETFEVFELPSPRANVRQILGRPGEVWCGESGTDKLVVIHTR